MLWVTLWLHLLLHSQLSLLGEGIDELPYAGPRFCKEEAGCEQGRYKRVLGIGNHGAEGSNRDLVDLRCPGLASYYFSHLLFTTNESDSAGEGKKDVFPRYLPTQNWTMSECITIGFDLDMTLVDSAAGICACMTEVLKRHQVDGVTQNTMYETIGRPLRDAFADWLPEDKIDEIVSEYREIFDSIAFPVMKLLPGAKEALELCKDMDVLVVSSRKQESLEGILDFLNIRDKFSAIKGGAFGDQKGEFLKEAGCAIYVGDHEGDIRGAKVGGCLSVAVVTGPSSRATLEAENPDVILDNLKAFPAWLSAHLEKGKN